MFYILLIFAIFFLIYLNIIPDSKEEFYNFSLISAQAYIRALTKRIDKLEFDIHNNEFHNKTEAKINALKKKYDPAYNYYMRRKVELKKAAAENLRAFSA